MVGGAIYFRGPIQGYSDKDVNLVELSPQDWEWLTTNMKPYLEAIDRLEQAWARTRDEVARAERAERILEFEKERRIEAERERDRLRSLLAAEHELAERVSQLERQRRLEVEQERDRLRAMLDAEPTRMWRRWMARVLGK